VRRSRAAELAAEALLRASKGDTLVLRFPARGALLSARKRLFSIRRQLEDDGKLERGAVVIKTREAELKIVIAPRVVVEEVGSEAEPQPACHDTTPTPKPTVVPLAPAPSDLDGEQARLLEALKDKLKQEVGRGT